MEAVFAEGAVYVGQEPRSLHLPQEQGWVAYTVHPEGSVQEESTEILGCQWRVLRVLSLVS